MGLMQGIFEHARSAVHEYRKAHNRFPRLRKNLSLGLKYLVRRLRDIIPNELAPISY